MKLRKILNPIQYAMTLLAIFGLSISSIFAQGGTDGDITWKIKNDTLTISGEGAIPDYYKDKWDWAPWHTWPNTFIIAVVIENGITRIGNGALLCCWEATSIIIPSSVTSFGYEAISCISLTSITNFNPVPVAINRYVFNCEDISACTLEIPINSVSAYRNADVWKEFNIVGMEVGLPIIEEPLLEIYPNPTTGKIYIETESEIKVYNLQGELLQKTFGNQVDLSTYPQGVYLLQANGRWSKVIKW